jgi:AcrR family transcriptional regulator
VGIGKGSIYLHFTSKEEIVLSHIDRIVARLKEKLSAISADGKTSVDQRLKKMLLTRVLFRFDSVQHYTMSLNDLLAALRQQFLARRKVYFDEEAKIFAAVIAEGQENRDLAAGDNLEIAKTLLTATNSLLPYNLSVGELGERAEIEEKTARLADLLLSGIVQRTS